MASSSSKFKKNYDVFLSFRSVDTCSTFIRQLHYVLVENGLRTFMDSVEPKSAKRISELFNAIEGSHVAVVIFSENYACSKWCLNELEKIVELMNEGKLIVLPIFYHVSPREVRSQANYSSEKGRYLKAINKMLSKYMTDRAKRRTKGLHKAGIFVFKGQDEANVFPQVIQKVMKILKFASYPVGVSSHLKEKYLIEEDFEMSFAKDHVIGFDDQVERIAELMNKESDRVLVIEIRGPDGIGKTTLAKAVFDRINSKFDACSFLREIKEDNPAVSSVRSLQIKLIRDILWPGYVGGTTAEEDFEVLKEVLSHMKVLIVLDDLEHVSHVKEFIGVEPCFLGLGSMIIRTTGKEDQSHAKDLGKDSTVDYNVHSVTPMNADLALQLFSLHVFVENSPGPDYSCIAKAIVDGLMGYPLLIEVIGSLLHNKNQLEFKGLSERIDSPALRVPDLLKIAYETLDVIQQKQIFLDIACFCANEDYHTATYMWYDCLNVNPNCISMPLAKLGCDGKMLMHSVLRNFGREIVRTEENRNKGICSRVFVHQKALDIIKNRMGTGVEALCLNFGDDQSEVFTAENFRKMPNLRFLNLDSAQIVGDFLDIFLPRLRWIKWKRCPMKFKAINVHLRELVILDLSGSTVTHEWKGWGKIKMVNLKVLNLANCAELITTPRFESFPNLRRLILEGCARLVRIDPSVCALEFLVHLNLKFCRELNNLPENLGYLEALRELWINGTGVEEIPVIYNLKLLESLTANNCSSLRFLHESIGELEELKELSLSGCGRLQVLPDTIGELGSLVVLDISGTGIAELPESIWRLQSLKVLKMESCFLRELSRTIGWLHNLEEIHASRCRNLKEITPEIGNLSRLRILELRYASIANIPESIGNLNKLETLDLLHCDNIKQLPRLPSSLKVLNVKPELRL